MNGKSLLFGRDEVEISIMPFVYRKMREQRRNERRLVEQRTTKHQVWARKSCTIDARSYRVARRLPVLTADSSFANGVGHSVLDALTAFYLNVRGMTLANRNTGQMATSTAIPQASSSDK